jgi:hypothetical protein
MRPEGPLRGEHREPNPLPRNRHHRGDPDVQMGDNGAEPRQHLGMRQDNPGAGGPTNMPTPPPSPTRGAHSRQLRSSPTWGCLARPHYGGTRRRASIASPRRRHEWG